MNKPNQISMGNLANAKDVECECGNNFFVQGLKIKEVSAIISPTGKKETIGIPTIYCPVCNKELKDKENE